MIDNLLFTKREVKIHDFSFKTAQNDGLFLFLSFHFSFIVLSCQPILGHDRHFQHSIFDF